MPTPDPYTGQLQPEGLPLHGAACPVPTGTVVETPVPGDGLLYGQPDRATPVFASALGALSAGQGPVSVGQSAQGSSGLAYEGHASSSGFTRCSGVPVSQVSSEFSSATTRGRAPKKAPKKSRRSRRSASSSGSSGRSHRCKRHRRNDSLSRAEFLEAFQSLAASLSGRPGGSDLGPPASASYAPQPVPTGHGWVTPAQTGLPHTVSRAPASPPAISLHPSAPLESDLDSLSGRHVDAAPPALTGSLSETSRPARSDASAEEDEELTRVQRLSISETELRLVQRDMIRVLGLPLAAEPTPPGRPSFKRKSGPTSGAAEIFSAMPLDRVCVDRIADIMGASKWSAFSTRVDKYYRFPTEDFNKYVATPTVPDSAKDKLAAERGSASSKLPFADKTRGRLEEVLKKLDSSSRFGMRTTSFLLLLSEYLAHGCNENSTVPGDMMMAALHCLDQGLRTVIDQFARISTLATSTRRSNVLDEGARKRLDALPLTGPDLFAGKFQESMEAEAKRLEATDKINLKKPQAPVPETAGRPKKQSTFVIPRRQPQKSARGSFRGRAETTGARVSQAQAFTRQLPRPRSNRGARAATPDTPGCGAGDLQVSGRPLAEGPVGGRLREFLGSWVQITSDRWVLETIGYGYALEFSSSPPVGHARSSDSGTVRHNEATLFRGRDQLPPPKV